VEAVSESRLIGLKELVAAAKPDECPFCGEPRRKRAVGGFGKGHRGPGRPAKGAPAGYDLTCGDDECARVAYRRYWRRDETARIREEKQRFLDQMSDPPATKVA